MHCRATQPIGGREAGVLGANLGDQLVLLALEPLETGLILCQAQEEPTDQSGERRPLLRRSHSGPVEKFIVHRNSDIFHSCSINLILCPDNGPPSSTPADRNRALPCGMAPKE